MLKPSWAILPVNVEEEDEEEEKKRSGEGGEENQLQL